MPKTRKGENGRKKSEYGKMKNSCYSTMVVR